MKRRVLVTGGAGFIGSRVARAGIRSGWDVAIPYQPNSDLSQLQDFQDRMKLYSLANGSHDIFGIVADFKPDLVLHLASVFVVAHTDDDIPALIDSNIAFGTQLLEAIMRNSVPYFVNTGSSWQHASDRDYEPVNLYAATKQAFQDILEYYIAAGSLSAITLQLFDTYGPGDPRPKLFFLLERAWRAGKPLEMSPGQQLIDLVYVDDVVHAFLLAAGRLFGQQVSGHEIYGVSSGRPIPLKELVETYQRVSGRKFQVVWGGRPYRDREVMVPWTRCRVLPGWAPEIGLEQGIRNCVDSSADHGNSSSRHANE